jgi:translation initiation factor 5A
MNGVETMGETKSVSVGTLQKGNYVVVDGAACKVSDTQTSRPGKHGHAKVRLTAVGLLDDKKRVIVMPGHDKIDTPIVDKKTAQVLSIQDNKATIMDSETYETFELEIPEELKKDCVEGCNIMYWIILDSKVMKQVKQ